MVGYNAEGEFGLAHNNPLTQLTKCPHKEVDRIFAGYSQTIYMNYDGTKIWSAGFNCMGQCGVNEIDQRIIKTLAPIKYFTENEIKIAKVCINIVGCICFFISDEGKLYGCGLNQQNQMGWNKDEIEAFESNGTKASNKYIPELIPDLENVIDVQSTGKYTIALCASNNEQLMMIITNWCRLHQAPDDIAALLLSFCKKSIVYSTTNKLGSGHPVNAEVKNKYGWNEIEELKDHNIIQIAANNSPNTLFLENNGTLWYCGQMNNDISSKTFIPKRFEYFIEHGIKIKQVKMSDYHILALDTEGQVYSWGSNLGNQCGLGHEVRSTDTPTLIQSLKEYVIVDMKCGHGHSVVITECDKYFMFGTNQYGECLVGNKHETEYPVRVDNVLKEKYNIKSIIDIALGYCNTRLICDL